jgi:hypothetical protein
MHGEGLGTFAHSHIHAFALTMYAHLHVHACVLTEKLFMKSTMVFFLYQTHTHTKIHTHAHTHSHNHTHSLTHSLTYPQTHIPTCTYADSRVHVCSHRSCALS